ncbi:MAG TPA: pilin [Candidatus Paceibacterota bacterium]
MLFAGVFFTPSLALAQIQVGPIFNEATDCSAGTSFLPYYCTLCNLLAVVQKSVNFFLILLVPVAAAVIIYGGFLIMFAGANPGGIAKGRSAIFAAIIGVAIAFGSWIIVNEVIVFLANGELFITAPWDEITCRGGAPPTPTVTSTPPPTDTRGGTPPTAEEKGLAAIVLGSGVCGGTKSCGGVGACETLRAVAAGEPPPVCSNNCTHASACLPNSNVHISTAMLTAIDSLKTNDRLSFTVSSITTGSHATNSKHYQGKAVDFIATGNTSYAQLEAKINEKQPSFVQCENLGGSKIPCSSSGVTHLHAEFR